MVPHLLLHEDNDVQFGQMVNLTRATRFDLSVAGQVAN